ncbi:hypothetical protein [Streptomyces sp. NPDC086010]|uniref:hypothetical protein n=1 Tax=Streptomyces sp. NPDC086010 TaxID=3365745 RepID=UPI0037D7D18D
MSGATRVSAFVESLLGTGPEFRALQNGPLVTGPRPPERRPHHPAAGPLGLFGGVLTEAGEPEPRRGTGRSRLRALLSGVPDTL